MHIDLDLLCLLMIHHEAMPNFKTYSLGSTAYMLAWRERVWVLEKRLKHREWVMRFFRSLEMLARRWQHSNDSLSWISFFSLQVLFLPPIRLRAEIRKSALRMEENTDEIFGWLRGAPPPRNANVLPHTRSLLQRVCDLSSRYSV